MESYPLYTYRNIAELRKIQEEREVYAFMFGDTKDLIDSTPNVCIDITALIYFLQSNNSNIQPVYVNFSEMTIDTRVIINASIADEAIEILPMLFSEKVCYFEENKEMIEEAPKYQPYNRQKVYRYNTSEDLDQIIQYANENGIPITTFSRANGDLKSQFERLNNSMQLSILDLTSVSYAIEDNKNLIYAVEQLLGIFSNIKVIAKTTRVDSILKYFPLFFDGQDTIRTIFPELTEINDDKKEDEQLYKITNLSNKEFDVFFSQFSYNLIGHKYFKERLQQSLKNFITLNKAKEQKVFSLFLFGSSGIGKTEVARLLANGLKEGGYLAKINFQNYSSQDALNSLIGSPAGYIGCDHGELSDKIKKSKVGILLCDEFEKTNRPVFSFFLELLEEGRFTDSMAREYDVDGYIIVFTSNIPNETEYKKTIPQELQTRFDLVCEFEEPTYEEKTKFLDLLLEKAYKNYPEQFAVISLSDEDKKHLYNFDYDSLPSLRDIKRAFNNRLIDFFRAKSVL